MSSTKWRDAAPISGPRARIATAVLVALALAWVGWPVWGSWTAPDAATARALMPSLISALGGLLLVLGWALWRDAGRRVEVFAPVVLVATAATLVRFLLSPGTSGVEPAFVLPLLAGAALGSPAGFLTGALACLGSSALLGLYTEHLVAQTLVWGLFGLVGGLFRNSGARAAWIGCVIAGTLLGPISGVLLNTAGWVGDAGAPAGGFLLGAGPWESLTRLVDYSLTTSFAVDTARGITTAVLAFIVGFPVIRGLRATVGDPVPSTTPIKPPPQRIDAAAIQRRERSDHLSTLWQPKETDDERSAQP